MRRNLLQIFANGQNRKNTIAKNLNGYIVFIVVMDFRKNFSIAKIFPSKFPGIFANIFKRKIIPVYSILRYTRVLLVL